MHDGMPYGRIQGQGQGHEPLKVRISSIFKTYLLRHLQGQGHEPIQRSRIENLQSREVDHQSPTGLIFEV